MSTSPPVVHIEDIGLKEHSVGGDFGAKLGSLTSVFGMQKLGCSLVELAPGKRAWPYHLHYGQEELFVILSGKGTLRYDGATQTVREGDIIFAPSGEKTAHQIINSSNETLKYLAFSSREDPELCYYPDSGKYGCYVDNDKDRVTFIAQSTAAVDYWQGEK